MAGTLVPSECPRALVSTRVVPRKEEMHSTAPMDLLLQNCCAGLDDKLSL